MATTEAKKVEGLEQPIPAAWRATLKDVVDALVAGRLPEGDSIRSIDAKAAEVSFENIRRYPDAAGPLSEASWTTSICAWMGGYWEVLVDLTNLDGSPSDLVLHAKAYDADGHIEVEPYMVYVP